jgi:hypothetical protein
MLLIGSANIIRIGSSIGLRLHVFEVDGVRNDEGEGDLVRFMRGRFFKFNRFLDNPYL